jgi:glycyl-tRNA synthetase beta chain
MHQIEDFLVEIGTEELPTKELQALANGLADILMQQLSAAQISFTATKTFVTPRRIAVLIKDLSAQQPEQIVSKRGPAISAAYNPDGSPTKAALGFATSCGVTMQELTTQETDKGSWLYFEQKMPGKKTVELLPAMLEKSLAQLPIKKHMRWGEGILSFARPIHWIVMLYGKDIVKANLYGLESSNISHGHRIHCPKQIKIATPDSYEQQLETEGKVIVDFDKRQQLILDSVNSLAVKENGTAVIDPELLTMVTGLVEYPVALTASFDPDFLRVPKECLISAMQDHQKCFALVDSKDNLLPKFILISNLASTEPQTVIHGNELVMNARLADAAFHFDKDRKQSLESRNEQLKTVVYQKQLGSIYDKVMRMQRLTAYLAPLLHAEPNATARATLLCKADLLTNMVYEFPELQGIMGCYYAKHDHESDAVAIAIQEHYKPKFAQDELPNSDIGTCIAIADRIDSLVGLFGIGSIPTGEKDPYGLRRQALAVVRMLIEKNLNLDLQELVQQGVANYQGKIKDASAELLNFCFERLKAWYLASGVPPKTFAAVLASNPTRPLDFHRRLNAVAMFQKLPEAASLAAANKRVRNLLEKSPTYKVNANPDINAKLIIDGPESMLFEALQNKELEIAPLHNKADYTAILQSLATLQGPVDNFFEHVMVMVDDEALKNNRLNLLQRLRNLFLQVADVSQL